MATILESLVWLQNLRLDIWAAVIFSLMTMAAFLLARAISVSQRVTSTGEVSNVTYYGDIFRRPIGRTALMLFFVAYTLLLFAAAKPLPNNAGMAPLTFQTVNVEDAVADEARARERDRRGKSLIVFLHGWRGDENTFGQFPALLSSDPAMNGFHYTTFRYTVHMVARNLNSLQIAKVLRAELLRANADKDYIKVYIVAHSLGGVIARQLFILNKLDSRNRLRLRGIVSVASPFNGTVIATIADTLGISQALTSDLGRDSVYLSILNETWTVALQHQQALWAYCFASTIDRVVSAESASFGCGASSEQVSDYGHVDLVKPISRDDGRYSRVMKTILRDGDL